MTTGLSASGARIRGDDYQHLFSWCQVLRAVIGESNITKIGIEDPEAGNADDVTVYMEDGKCEYYQVKSSVDARNTVGTEWLMESTKSGGPSIVQGFYRLWAGERGEHKPRITLVTNRILPAADTLLSLRDGRDGTVARRLQNAETKSKVGTVRMRLAEHLGVTEDEVVLFFHDLRFKLGRTNDDWAELAKERMYMASLRHDEGAVAQGVEIVRGWVTGGRREITTAELWRAVEPLKQPGNSPTASILVQAIDRDPVPEAATTVLDWVNLFPGSEPRARHQPSDSALWNDKFRPELRQAARDLRLQGHTHVLVKGHMRLPTWFAVGVELGKTAGFEVSSFQGQTVWPSVGNLSDVAIGNVTTTLGLGKDLAVGIALASDPSPDVLEYLRDWQINVGKYVCVRPTNGPNNQAISNAAEARGWAYGVRDAIRRLVQEYRPGQIHLFLAGPHSAILLLGHLWDRMPRTQIYEDLGSTKGYAPSYLIPS